MPMQDAWKTSRRVLQHSFKKSSRNFKNTSRSVKKISQRPPDVCWVAGNTLVLGKSHLRIVNKVGNKYNSVKGRGKIYADNVIKN